jgi:hypothetical protein
MRAAPHDLSVVEHDDEVGARDRRDPLGDDEDGRAGDVAESACLRRASVAVSSAEKESSKM